MAEPPANRFGGILKNSAPKFAGLLFRTLFCWLYFDKKGGRSAYMLLSTNKGLGSCRGIFFIILVTMRYEKVISSVNSLSMVL